MNISNTEIAKAAYCTEGTVRAAVSAQRLNPSSLESVLGFVLTGRLKAQGIDGVFGLKGPDTLPAGVQRGCAGIGEPIIDRSESQE
jgi:hypothetical protein